MGMQWGASGKGKRQQREVGGRWWGGARTTARQYGDGARVEAGSEGASDGGSTQGTRARGIKC